MSALIEFDEVCKYYQMGDTTVKAADHITMKIDKGEFVAIVGQSGSGKSTCMNIIGCLDVPTHGTYRLNGKDVGKMSRNELAAIRNEMLGFIFQQYNLLPRLNLLENVEVPLVYAGIPAPCATAAPARCWSGWALAISQEQAPTSFRRQQQRVSIARALVRNPAVILADEPPVRWTPTPAAKCWRCSSRCTRRATPSSSSPTIIPSPYRPTASSAWRMAGWCTTAIPTRGGLRPADAGAGDPGGRKGGGSMIVETFRQAIQNVWSNKLRTFLTMLGIIIGVMAVIVIVGLGNGMTQSMRDSFSAMGTNTLSINIWATAPAP